MAPKDLIGKPAPKITLPSATEESYTLDPSTVKKPIVLFFYPAAQTYGCTKEACSFRDALASKPLYSGSGAEDAGVLVVGISPDGVEKQKAFAEQHKLTYPLLCDVDGVATKAYGVTRGLLGLTPGRTTFIIDKGIVQDVHDSVINYAAHEKFVTKWLEKRAGAKPSEPEPAAALAADITATAAKPEPADIIPAATTTTEAEAAAEHPVEAVAPTDAALPPSALAADAAAPA